MQKALTMGVGLLLGAETLLAQAQLSDSVKSFVRVDAPLVALEHVRVIDGTGAPPAEDQTVVIQNGRIRALGLSASTAVPEGAKALDLSGYTVIPGLVGMHDHLFYPSPHVAGRGVPPVYTDRKSTRLNSSHVEISYAVFCLKKKKNTTAYTL